MVLRECVRLPSNPSMTVRRLIRIWNAEAGRFGHWEKRQEVRVSMKKSTDLLKNARVLDTAGDDKLSR